MPVPVLQGLRVLECAQGVAGPFCGKLLAELGAEVIKVEPPQGDAARRMEPLVQEGTQSSVFLYFNCNKRGVTLDLEERAGRSLFRRLVPACDVVIEDTAPNALARRLFSYGRLKKLNPALVLVSVTPFGRTGPYARYKAYPLNTYHAGGDAYLLYPGAQHLDDPPVGIGGHASEAMVGMTAAVAALGAVLGARATGVGAHMDVSGQEALLALNRNVFGPAVHLGRREARETRAYPYAGIVPCKDGYVMANVFTEDHHWAQFLHMMGDPDWGAQFPTHEDRRQHGTEVNALITQWTLQHTKAEIYAKAVEHQCPVGPVSTPADLPGLAPFMRRGFFQRLDLGNGQAAPVAQLPFLLSGMSRQPVQPAPALGEHNDDVYGQLLGLGSRTLKYYKTRGVL